MAKYKNKKTEIDGITFDSKKEANYYGLLKLLKSGGDVLEFHRQVLYELVPKFKDAKGHTVRAINYRADFVVKYADGHIEVVDVKGYRTKEYLLKRKLFLYRYRDLLFVEV